MACFLVPLCEAIATTAAAKVIERKEKKAKEGETGAEQTPRVGLPFSRKLRWLTNMLWGGSALLAFEHLWHGEIVPWFPFLTAMRDPGETAEMLHEMATVGVTMAVFVTLVWLGMLGVTGLLEKRQKNRAAAEEGRDAA